MTIPRPLAPSPTDLARDGTADLAFAGSVQAMSAAEAAFYRAAFPAWVRRAVSAEGRSKELLAALAADAQSLQGEQARIDRLAFVVQSLVARLGAKAGPRSPCQNCHGSGWVEQTQVNPPDDGPCLECDGCGWKEDDEEETATTEVEALRDEVTKLRAELVVEERLADGDGTRRLLTVLYGSEKGNIRHAIGGPQTRMLWDAAEEIERLREENEGLRRMVDSLAAERQVLHGVTEED